jgi:hypothetical protein
MPDIYICASNMMFPSFEAALPLTKMLNTAPSPPLS